MADAGVKMAHIVNESLDGYVQRPLNEDFNKFMLTYATRCGGLPRDGIEPTPDQVGALQQVVATGMTPYVDFSLWGRHMKRALKKLQHSASLFDPNTGK